ncbi:MAG: tetratricopeptide repeat protein [Acidobacteriaceae bacterium]
MSNRWLATTPFFLATALLLPAQSHAAATQTPAPNPPTRVLLPVDAGDLLFAHGKFVEAIDAYSRAPHDAATLNKIGVAWHHLSAVDQARMNYEKALSLRPNFPEALNNLGAVYFSHKNYSRAIRLYRRALQLSPDSAVTSVNLGTAWFAEGKSDRGLQAYRSALAMDSDVFDLDSPQIVDGPISDEDRARQDYCIAELFAQMNSQERALDFLRRAFASGFKDRHRLADDPAFATLRTTPEYASLTSEFHLQ